MKYKIYYLNNLIMYFKIADNEQKKALLFWKKTMLEQILGLIYYPLLK